MPNPPYRLRPIQVKFFVTAEELEQIKQRMAGFGTENLSAHLRKLALEGTYEIEEKNGNPEKEI